MSHHSENTPSTEILSIRTEAIVKSIAKMIESGVSKEDIRHVHTHNFAHKDFWMVFLGIKPMASILHPVLNLYPGPFPAELETGIKVLIDRHNMVAWNPEQLLPLLEQCEALATPEEITHFQLHTPKKVYNENKYGRTLRSFDRHKKIMMYGILHGFPPEATRLYEKYYDRLLREAKLLWAKAKESNIILFCPEAPFDLIELVGNRGRSREQMTILAEQFGMEPEMLWYLRNMRIANVVGFKYLTAAYLTTEEEHHINTLYNASKLDEKLAQLLR